eukprot:COSAG01_NODE_3863_length_5621_cov_2.450970_9_plen_66_part_00
MSAESASREAGLHRWMERTLDLPPVGYYEKRAAEKAAAAAAKAQVKEVVAAAVAGVSSGEARPRL